MLTYWTTHADLSKASEIHDTLIDYRIKHIEKWTAYLRQEQRRPSLSDPQALRRIEAAVRDAVIIEGAERTLPRTRDLHLEQARLLAHALHQHQYNLIWNRRGRLNHGVWFLTVKLAGDNLIDLLIKVQRFTGDFSDDEVRQILTEPLIYSALEKMWSIALQLYRMKNFGTKPTEPRACPYFAMDLLAPMQLDALQLTKTILLQWLVDAAQQYDDWITEGALPATDQAPMLNNI